MKIYFAPLEGITGYIYRRAHHKYYGGIEKYFTPFLSPTQNPDMTNREFQDVLPEHNEGMYVVPQILTNRSDYFIRTALVLKEMGYGEINLNLGCPSGTVVAKKKGAGFLAFPEELFRFLDDIYSGLDMKISIKTRIGVESAEEFPALTDIFRQFPVCELIIHPRVQKSMYRGVPDMDCFSAAYESYSGLLCYNGDITTVQSYENIAGHYPNLDSVMIGRGLLSSPSLGEEIQGKQNPDFRRFLEFHDEILHGYMEIMSGDRNTLFKMKELWFYFIQMFPGKEKIYKKIKKATTIAEYQSAVELLFQEGEKSQ